MIRLGVFGCMCVFGVWLVSILLILLSSFLRLDVIEFWLVYDWIVMIKFYFWEVCGGGFILFGCWWVNEGLNWDGGVVEVI